MSNRYPTGLSDAEWNYIDPHLPAPKGFGRPRAHSLREILNAVFYLLKSGCQWQLLPHDFPRWPTVYCYFRKWRMDVTWQPVNRALRERLRVRSKRDPQPSACVVDSQSVKSTAVGGEERGFDGGKKVKGRLSATYWWTPKMGGNRHLNYALHMVATSQAKSDAPGRAYYRKKLDEAKSRKEALRCLKRRVSDAVFRSITADLQAPSHRAA